MSLSRTPDRAIGTIPIWYDPWFYYKNILFWINNKSFEIDLINLQLIIGNFGLSYEQSKTQFALWAIMAAPLLMSVDLRTIRPEFKAILKNRKIIAVDQDPLGIQGRRIYKHKGIEIWSRPITPIYQTYYSYAVAFVNRRTDGTPSDVAVTLRELGLQSPSGYRVEDLYEEVDYGVLSPMTKIKVKVNPSGKNWHFAYFDKSCVMITIRWFQLFLAGVVILRCDVQPERSYRTPYNPLQYFHL